MTAFVPGTQERDLGRYALSLQQLAAGRSNAVVAVTLTASATTTVVDFANCASGSAVIPCPLTAHAAAEIGAGTMYVSAIANGSFTLTHASNSQTDRDFLFAVIG